VNGFSTLPATRRASITGCPHYISRSRSYTSACVDISTPHDPLLIFYTVGRYRRHVSVSAARNPFTIIENDPYTMQLSATRTTATRTGMDADSRASAIMCMDAMLESALACPNQTDEVARTRHVLSNALDSENPVAYMKRIAKEDSAKGREARWLAREAGITLR